MAKKLCTSKSQPKTLDRVFSKAGVGSRSDARSWIGAGRVRVNGKVVQNPDHWIDAERDRVTLDGKPLRAVEKIYVLLYKPTGYVVSHGDPQNRPTVYDLVRDAGKWLSPVGRLDLETSGLLILTNDNDFAERVTNPDHKAVPDQNRPVRDYTKLLKRGTTTWSPGAAQGKQLAGAPDK